MGKKKTYRHVDPVRQQDEMACWAACMKWWKKAVRSINRSQQHYLDTYVGLTTAEGGMDITGMKTFIQREGLNVDEPGSMDFTLAKLKDHLAHSPLFVAYVGDDQNLHVNVIHELVNEVPGSIERYSQVRVMEPQEFTGGGNWKGVHKLKSLGDYTWFGTCMIGSLKP